MDIPDFSHFAWRLGRKKARESRNRSETGSVPASSALASACAPHGSACFSGRLHLLGSRARTWNGTCMIGLLVMC